MTIFRLLLVLLLLSPCALAQPIPPSGGGGLNPNGGDASATVVTSTGSNTAISLEDRFAQVVSILDFGASSSASDNAVAIQNAINAAVSAKAALRIPAASSCYKYTAPLTISGDLTIFGDGVSENWNAGINVPLGSPPLQGSVLCPSSNGSDAIDISGTSLNVSVSDLGVLFQTPMVGTGDAFHYVPATNVMGLAGAFWHNVKVYGHDGDHYAYNFGNFIYGTFASLYSYGGGGFNLNGTGSSFNFGNSTFIQPYVQLIAGGSAYGINITASASQRLNLLTFVRPQSISHNQSGVSPSAPTSSQYLVFQDDNVQNVKMIGPDFESTVSAPIQVSKTNLGNDWDWSTLFSTAGSITASSWTTNGLLYGPPSRTITDNTSTGTVAIEAAFAFPNFTQKATSATTYTNLATLYLGTPTASTNVTATRSVSLYTAGQIFSNGSITAPGLFVSGTVQLNHNNGASTTAVGDGTTTGTVTIGGASNTTNLASGTVQVGGVAAVSCAANTVTLATFVVTNGIVTHC